MQYRHHILIAISALSIGLAGCATSEQPGTGRLALTDDAAKIVNEKGEAVAARAGSRESRQQETDLVCESVKRTGSHMTQTYCYSRKEQERTADKLRAELQRIKDGGMRVNQQDPEGVPAPQR